MGHMRSYFVNLLKLAVGDAIIQSVECSSVDVQRNELPLEL